MTTEELAGGRAPGESQGRTAATLTVTAPEPVRSARQALLSQVDSAWLPVRLLPILAIYVLVSLAVPTAPNDEATYIAYARHLLHLFAGPSYGRLDFLWHGPGLPGVLAPLVAAGAPATLIRLVAGPVALFAAMLVFHRLVRLYVGRERQALAATYAVALYLPFFTTVGHIHVEVIGTLWLTLATLLMVRSFRGSQHDHIWAGLALAILALSRPEFGYVLTAGLLLAVVWVVASRRSTMARRCAVTTALALILCAPWLAYTYAVTGKPFYWGDSGGLQLYWMTTPDNPLGDWHGENLASTSPAFAADRQVFSEVDHLASRDRDPRLQHVALQNIVRYPKHYVSSLVFNVGRLLFNSPYSFDNAASTGTSPGWGLIIYALPNALLIGLMSLSAFIAVRVRKSLRPEILPIATFLFLAFAIHIPVAAYGRFLLPLVPVSAWFIVAVLADHLRLVPTKLAPRARSVTE